MESTKLAFSLQELWDLTGIGKSLYYKVRRAGAGPKTFMVGGKVLVSREAALAWIKDREEEEAAKLLAASGAPVVALAPVLPAQDAAPAVRSSSIESPRLAAPRRTDFAPTFNRGNKGGMPGRRMF